MIDETMRGEAMFAGLCSDFAILALAIACVGLYGAIAHTVGKRTNEIGLRIALGASRPRMVWLMVRQVTLVAAISLIAGVIAAFGLSRLLDSLPYGFKPADPATIAAALATLLAAAGTAAFIPARRASQIQPLAALRHE